MPVVRLLSTLPHVLEVLPNDKGIEAENLEAELDDDALR